MQPDYIKHILGEIDKLNAHEMLRVTPQRTETCDKTRCLKQV